VPRAYVVLEPRIAITEQEILAYCRENLSRYKVPVAIEFRTELPRTFIGKVLRRVLAEDRLHQGLASTGGAGEKLAAGDGGAPEAPEGAEGTGGTEPDVGTDPA